MIWYCTKCGQIVVSDVKPAPISWSDGHVCYFAAEELDGEAFELSDQKAKEEFEQKFKGRT